MKKYKIAVIHGDGIGPEVINEGVKVLKTIADLDRQFQFDFTYFPWGCEYYSKYGKMMDDDGIEKLKQFDAIYLGAVGFPGVPDHISLWDLLLKIRKSFDQYVNIRPVTLLQGAPCPLKDVKKEDINMLFIRENTEGEYSGAGIGSIEEKNKKSFYKIVYFLVKERKESYDLLSKQHEEKENH